MITKRLANRGKAFKSSIFLGALLVSSITPRFVSAAESSIDSVQIGFSALFKVGHWVPISINTTSPKSVTGRIQLITVDGEGTPYAIEYKNQKLGPGNTTLNLLVKFGRVDSYLTVRFTPDKKDQDAFERMFASDEIPNAMPTRERLIVAVGSDAGIEQALRQRRRTSNDQFRVALVDAAGPLPGEWIGYMGVDLLVLPTLTSDAIHRLTTSQSAAIVEYVRRGGRVVFSAAERAEAFFSGSNPLGDLLPGRFVETIKETRTGGIEEYVGGASQRLDRSESEDIEFQYSLARVSDVTGQVLASEGVRGDRSPLIIAGYLGIGQTVYTAFDLDASMLTNWQDRTKLLNRLVEIIFPRNIDSEDERSFVSMTRSGFDDLTGQLRVSLESFPAVRLTNFSVVAVFCVLYLAMIGPVDYFLLQRCAKSFFWTWLTFPLAVVGFCAAAYFFSAWTKSVDYHLSALHIVDVDHQQANGSSWLSLFSPRSEIHDYSLAPTLGGMENVMATRLTWQGLPGSGFGGMNGGVTARSKEPQYVVRSDTADDGCKTVSMNRLPIATNSSRNFFGTWRVQLPDNASRAESSLEADREKQLAGTVVNPTSVNLSNCMLVYDRWTYDLQNLGAGETKSLLGIIARDIKTPITRQRVKNGRSEMTIWDRESTDRARIGQMLMFYNSIRGESYTRLFHRYQNLVDGSSALKSGRAFLVGQADKSPVDLQRDGQVFLNSDRDHVTYYRISIPVRER